jgi:hypothetical protein
VILYDCFSLQLQRMMESDAAMTEDLIAYNIIPLDGPTLTNAIVGMPEVSFLPSMYVSSSLLKFSFYLSKKKKKKMSQVHIWLLLPLFNPRNVLSGASSSVSFKILYWFTDIAFRFFYSCDKGC